MDKENLLEIFETSNSLSEVLKKIGVNDSSKNWQKIKDKAVEIGFDIEIYKKRKKRYCLNCGKELKKGQKKFCSNSCSATFNNKGRVLSEETRDKIREKIISLHPEESTKKIKEVKLKKTRKQRIRKKTTSVNHCLNCGKEIKSKRKYCSINCFNDKKRNFNYEYFINNPEKYNYGGYVPVSYKDFFMGEQNYKCAVCGCEPFWNGKVLVFVIDHIDGDASNNSRENIRMICPNCDSQTDTFKSKNKFSTRRNYWKEKILKTLENKDE